jgi:hypothetical protein
VKNAAVPGVHIPPPARMKQAARYITKASGKTATGICGMRYA